jgi:MYXO-CTERM domain-containing protein
LPSVSFDGENWLVAWWDMRAWIPGFDLHVTPPTDVYGARVTTTGAVLDPSGFGIATGVGDETEVALSGSASRSLVVYRQSAGPVDEVKARLVGPDPTGGTGGMGGGGAGNGGTAGAAGADDGGAGGSDGGMGGDDGVAGDGTTGGSSGEAGEAGSSTGGSRPTGGSGGRGGAGRGGTSGASNAGQAGSGTNPPPPGDDDDDGCGCRVPGTRSTQRPAWILGLVFGLFAARRRRRNDA